MINVQNGKLNHWLRITALAVSILFTLNTIVCADGAGNSLTTLRLSTQKNYPQALEQIQSLEDFFCSTDFPRELGDIKHSFRGSKPKLVVHIQDAHVNQEAQQRIAQIIDYFAEKKGARLVHVEGASGELAHHFLSTYPNDKARKLVADYFLREGLITGPEYLAISRRPNLILYGAEDQTLYDENRKAFLEALEFKGRDEQIIAKLDKVVNAVARHVLSEYLLDFIYKRQAFEQEKKDLISYVQYLVASQPSSKNYPQIQALINLLELERELNQEKAEQEVGLLIDELKKNLTGAELIQFIKKTGDFRTNKLSRGEYYAYLAALLPQMKSASEFPDLAPIR